MTQAYPRLRTDVLISRQETPEGPAYVLKDPRTGRFFRFKEVEGFVLQQLDGGTSAEAICQSVLGRFDAALTPERLKEFTAQLAHLGLLDTGAAAGLRPPAGKRVRGNPFYLRFKLYDPDQLFTSLARSFRGLFTPRFVVFSALLIAAAFAVTVSNWDAILRDIVTLFRFQSLLLAWFVVLIVITLHEFAHGVTCKHFGGQVHEIGFMLLYFQPAFYCNVSDAWLFPQKSRRLWVTFAGAYFEIFLWGLATLAWRFTDPHTGVNHASLVVMATSGIKSLFNLNPLIKLDGYYLLSDALDVPNLRRNAFAALGDVFRKLIGSEVRRGGSVSPRERRIYLTYSLLAGAYSYWFFALILSGLGGYLVTQYQGWGFVLFLAFLVGMFRSSIARLFTMGKTQSAAQGAAPIRFTRKMKTGAVALVLLLILVFYRTDLRVSGEFVILPFHNADIRATVDGIIEKVYYDEGDPVEAGAPIVALAGRDYRAEHGKVRALLEEKQAKLKLLEAGTRKEEITLSRTLVEKAQERLKYARKDLDMDRALFEKQIISAKQLAQTEGTVAVREKELQEASDNLRILQAGSRKEEIEATRAEVASLRSQEQYLVEQVAALMVTSPIRGMVTTHKLHEKVGQHVNKGDLIAEVHELTSVEAEIALPEKEIADVRVGSRVLLKARAYPQEEFEGIVASIAPTASRRDDPSGERTILVVTELENPKLLLKPEMSGNAKIYCGERRLIEIVGRRLVRFIRVEFWSWW